MPDVWSALQARKRANPGAPLVTYLAAKSGERVELSGVSVENAAAKIANALRGEYDLDHGSTVDLRLPLHWQRTAWLAGVWTAGCIVLLGDQQADLAVLDQNTVVSAAPKAREVLAVSLHPFGLPISATLPGGVVDATFAVRNQPDAYLFDPPTATMTAATINGVARTQADLWDNASDLAREWGVSEGARVLIRGDLDTLDALTACLVLPLWCAGSVVLAAGDIDVDQVVDTERVTAIGAPRP